MRRRMVETNLKKNNRNIEILAPAGSYEGMRAAMNAGCDAVYIGGSSFGARAYANNLDEDTLLRAIDEAHIRNKRIYLTVNTLVKEDERLEKLDRYLDRFYERGLDAVIVQDLGVLHYIHRNFPDLPIHASTQMTLTMAEGANLLKGYNVTRLVTSRELSFKEIRAIRDNTDMEIETFVHGALCYCYSGQCLMSSMIGGRSGNRGRCAQPCRMSYQFYSENSRISNDEETYLLSPKDINTVAYIPELIEAGVDSFKIEGRMKRPEYAAAVTSIYRKYVDYYLEQGKDKYKDIIKSDIFNQDMMDLMDIYNRGGFSGGYGKTYNGKKMMSLTRPNHSGVYVGDVIKAWKGQVKIDLKENINSQDVLEIRDGEDKGYEFTTKDPMEAGRVLTANIGKAKLKPGLKVYRTKNNSLLDKICKEYIDQDVKQPIFGSLYARSGDRLKLTLKSNNISVTAYQDIVQEATKQPMTKEKLLTPIMKTGETPYYFEKLDMDMGDNVFVPVSWLNEIRREAIELLQEKVLHQYRRNLKKEQEGASTTLGYETSNILGETDNLAKDNIDNKSMGLSVTIQTKDQFKAALEVPEVDGIYVTYDMIDYKDILPMAEEAVERGKDFYLVLPYICRLSLYERLNKELPPIIAHDNIKGFIVKNMEELALVKSLIKDKPKEIILNYNMYVYNKEAYEFWREKGISHFTAPVELNYGELKALGIKECDMVVYGHQPVMVSAQCLYASTSGCIKQKGIISHNGHLVDRISKKFFVQTNCDSCYNIIYNGQSLSLLRQVYEVKELDPRNIRLDFIFETKEITLKVIKAFANAYIHNKNTSLGMSDKTEYTTGHFKRGIE
ncbi:MAG TPA: U32 family peptidase [Clostridiales bacterium]|nr:U32 family peptidase [Clostridiales bacterium]